MNHVVGYLTKFIENPEILNSTEKAYWSEIEPLLHELLDELKANDKIETFFTESKITHMKNLLQNALRLGNNSNWITNGAMKSDEVAQKFLEATSPFGLNEELLVNIYIDISVLSCILHTEVFKTLILFHLKGVSTKVSNFSKTMQQFAPLAWARLKPFVDSKFRNSLAHSTWAIENEKVVLFEDADVVPYEILTIDDFIAKAKKLNILYACLAHVLITQMADGLLDTEPVNLKETLGNKT
jgi:hypothetical protein